MVAQRIIFNAAWLAEPWRHHPRRSGSRIASVGSRTTGSTAVKYEPITEFSPERCEILARVIEQQTHTTPDAADGFSMARERHTCGTPCCIAGFAAEMLTHVDGNPITRFLGCTEQDGMELYYGWFPTAANPSNEPAGDYLLDITPAEAAAALRALAAKRQEQQQ
jgi:hypothetical protein